MGTDLAPRTIDILDLIPEVKNSVMSPSAKRGYTAALAAFIAWNGGHELERSRVLQYRQHLLDEGKAPSTINIALSAIRKLAEEAETHGYLSEREAAHIRRVDGVPMRGVRFGNWLSKEQALELLTKPDQNKNAGLRDFVLLGLLLGCGLRREEAIGVRCEQIVDRDGRLVLLDIVGKGRKLRTVVIPRWLEEPIRTWMQQIRDSGLLLRRVSSEDNISESGITGEGSPADHQEVRRRNWG